MGSELVPALKCCSSSMSAKKGAEGVEVLRGIRVVFVMVALSTSDGGAHPDRGDIADAVSLIDCAVFGLL